MISKSEAKLTSEQCQQQSALQSARVKALNGKIKALEDKLSAQTSLETFVEIVGDMADHLRFLRQDASLARQKQIIEKQYQRCAKLPPFALTAACDDFVLGRVERFDKGLFPQTPELMQQIRKHVHLSINQLQRLRDERDTAMQLDRDKPFTPEERARRQAFIAKMMKKLEGKGR